MVNLERKKDKLFTIFLLNLFGETKMECIFAPILGLVVQLVRIPACHAGGRGFESRPLRHLFLIVKNKVLKYNDTLFFAVHFYEKKPN